MKKLFLISFILLLGCSESSQKYICINEDNNKEKLGILISKSKLLVMSNEYYFCLKKGNWDIYLNYETKNCINYSNKRTYSEETPKMLTFDVIKEELYVTDNTTDETEYFQCRKK